MAQKAKTTRKGAAPAKPRSLNTAKRGKGTQPEAAVLKEQKPRKVASLRIGGAQSSAGRSQQKRRDSR